MNNWVANYYTHRGLGSDKLKADISVADGESVLDCACILGLCLRLVKRPRPRSRPLCLVKEFK
jgi:hypothetical protein